jgi:hypothetical protein
MKIRHGALAIDLPAEWQDQSTLLFVAPRQTETLATTATVEQPTEAISVTFVTDDDEPQGILARQAESMTKLDAAFEVLKQGPFTTALGEGWCYEQRFEMGGSVVRQLAVACRVGRVVVVATGAAVDARFERHRDKLTTILASLQIGEME